MENCQRALVSFTLSPKTGPATARPSRTGLGPPSRFRKCSSAAVKSENSAMRNLAIGPRASRGDSRAKRMFVAPMSATSDGKAVSSLFISIVRNSPATNLFPRLGSEKMTPVGQLSISKSQIKSNTNCLGYFSGAQLRQKHRYEYLLIVYRIGAFKKNFSEILRVFSWDWWL